MDEVTASDERTSVICTSRTTLWLATFFAALIVHTSASLIMMATALMLLVGVTLIAFGSLGFNIDVLTELIDAELYRRIMDGDVATIQKIVGTGVDVSKAINTWQTWAMISVIPMLIVAALVIVLSPTFLQLCLRVCTVKLGRERRFRTLLVATIAGWLAALATLVALAVVPGAQVTAPVFAWLAAIIITMSLLVRSITKLQVAAADQMSLAVREADAAAAAAQD